MRDYDGTTYIQGPSGQGRLKMSKKNPPGKRRGIRKFRIVTI